MSGADGFDLAAAGLRFDAADVARSMEVLAGKLEQALPGCTRVQRRGGGLLGRGARRVCEVLVELGANRYQLALQGERVKGFREKQVGGIAIKREELDTAAWLSALTADLQQEAQRSSEAREALEKLLR